MVFPCSIDCVVIGFWIHILHNSTLYYYAFSKYLFINISVHRAASIIHATRVKSEDYHKLVFVVLTYLLTGT